MKLNEIYERYCMTIHWNLSSPPEKPLKLHALHDDPLPADEKSEAQEAAARKQLVDDDVKAIIADSDLDRDDDVEYKILDVHFANPRKGDATVHLEGEYDALWRVYDAYQRFAADDGDFRDIVKRVRT